MKAFLLSILGSMVIGVCMVNTALATNIDPVDKLPKVFKLGTHEQEYERLATEHQTLLLTACDDDMDGAFQKWVSMMSEMEKYAELVDYDIKGVKMWLHVFWNRDGSIRHIAYFLKGNSRNMEESEFAAFLSSFMNRYRFPLTFTSKFSHYGSASFPVFSNPVKKNNNDISVKKNKGKD